MDFFKLVKHKLLLAKLPELIIMPFIALLMGILFISCLINDGEVTPASFLLLIVCIVSVISFILTLRDNNEYKELMRQIKLFGDTESIAEVLSNIYDNPNAKGSLKFNNSILFYLHHKTAKIVEPSKITEISVFSYRGTRGVIFHLVRVRYKEENLLSIEAHDRKSAELICKELEKTFAPYLHSN